MTKVPGRRQVTEQEIQDALKSLEVGLRVRIDRHGSGVFVSTHETLGIITEEYHELVEAVHQNDAAQVRKEMMDIAVPCLWGLICSKAGDLNYL